MKTTTYQIAIEVSTEEETRTLKFKINAVAADVAEQQAMADLFADYPELTIKQVEGLVSVEVISCTAPACIQPKPVQTCAAYSVVDLNMAVIPVPAHDCDHLNPSRRIFCMAIPNSRGQYHFAQVSPGNVWDYYAQIKAEVTEETITLMEQRGDEFYWLNLCGVALTATPQPQEEWILIQPGQLVKMAGKTLRADIKRGYPTLTVVA